MAIQIDGVTRARTALLTLRGSALPLNHAFNLELERARQLRIVVLTPGTVVLTDYYCYCCYHPMTTTSQPFNPLDLSLMSPL